MNEERISTKNRRIKTTDHQDENMPKLKYTKRRAKTTFACNECASTFTQRTNYLRHLGIIHGKDKDGELITESELQRMRGYNAKRKGQQTTKKAKVPKSVAFVQPSSSSSSPKASRASSPPTAAVGRPPSRASSSIPGPSSTPPPSIAQLHEDLYLSSDSADEYFVFVEPDEEEEKSPEKGRIPTRPRLPSIRALRKTVSAPEPPPKPKQIERFRKRRKAVTAERLAKSAEKYTHSTQELADEIGDELSMDPNERKRCRDVLRGMRVAQRRLCRRIRQQLPLNAGKKERITFLAWLESTITEVEGRSSDEFD